MFCRIAAHEEDTAYVATETDKVIVFSPLDPVTVGHLLVVPKEHAEQLHELSAASAVAAIAMVAHLGRHLASDYNLIQSNGEAATQTVPHVHFHLVPRVAGDGLHLPWTAPAVAGGAVTGVVVPPAAPAPADDRVAGNEVPNIEGMLKPRSY